MKKPAKTFREVLAEIESPQDIGQGSWALPENATLLEKVKFELCQKLLGYQMTNSLTDQDLRQKTGLSQTKLEDILFCRIEKVNSDELINAVGKTFSPCEMEIIVKGNNKFDHVRTV